MWSIKVPKTARHRFLFIVLLLSFSCHFFAAVNDKDVAYLQQMFDSSQKYVDEPKELTFLNQMYKVALKQRNNEYIGQYYRCIINYYYNKLNLACVRKYYNLAKPFYTRTKNFDFLFDTQSMLINLYTWDGDYEMAAAMGIQMYNDAAKLNLSNSKTSACIALGYTYTETKKYREAIEWLQKGLTEKYLSEKPIRKIALYSSLFQAYSSIEEYDNAEKCLKQTEEVVKYYNQPNVAAKTKESLNSVNALLLWRWSCAALLELNRKNLPLAKKQLDKATAYYNKHLSSNFDIHYLMTAVSYYEATKEYDKAMQYQNIADSVAKSFSGFDLMLMQQKAELLLNMGNYTESTKLLKQLIAKNDSDTKEEIKNQNVGLNSLYNVDKLQAEGKQARWNIILQSVIIISLLILVLLSFIIVRRGYKDKKIAKNAMLEAKKTDEQTSKFLHHMNEELEKQLEGIASLTERLSVEKNMAVRKQYSTEIKKTNELLQYVIFNVLDVSKIESGRMKLQFNNESLPGIFQEVIRDTADMFSSQIKLRVTECPALFIKTDRFRLKQILNSVIHYFASRTKMGEISFRCIENGDKLEFTVFDDGYIMNVSEARRIFDRSAQTMVELKDMGLDMIISKQIARQMNGDAWIDSDESGTTFYFNLPLEKIDEEEEEQL